MLPHAPSYSDIDPDVRLLSEDDALAILGQYGFQRSRSWMRAIRRDGRGPRWHKAGRQVLYEHHSDPQRSPLLRWLFASQLVPVPGDLDQHDPAPVMPPLGQRARPH